MLIVPFIKTRNTTRVLFLCCPNSLFLSSNRSFIFSFLLLPHFQHQPKLLHWLYLLYYISSLVDCLVDFLSQYSECVLSSKNKQNLNSWTNALIKAFLLLDSNVSEHFCSFLSATKEDAKCKQVEKFCGNK